MRLNMGNLRSTKHVLEDEALPALKQALDEKSMLNSLTQATGIDQSDAADLSPRAEVIDHKPGRRCTIRYDLSYFDAPGQSSRLLKNDFSCFDGLT